MQSRSWIWWFSSTSRSSSRRVPPGRWRLPWPLQGSARRTRCRRGARVVVRGRSCVHHWPLTLLNLSAAASLKTLHRQRQIPSDRATVGRGTLTLGRGLVRHPALGTARRRREAPHVKLHEFPRYPLTFGPSPVHQLDRLTKHLGGATRLGQARGLQLGARLRRQQDPQARVPRPRCPRQGADTLVSIGGVQSNHTRQVAAVAAKLGLKCRLVQEKWVDWDDPSLRPGGQHLAVAHHGR